MRQSLSSPTPLKKERRNRALSKFLWFVVIVTALFVGVGLLSHIPKLMINSVSISGLKVLDENDVSRQTLEYLEGRVALVYARGNIFIYSKKHIEEFIKAEFPRVYAIHDIQRAGRSLTITLEERQAALAWCGSDAPTYETRFEKRECYFLDQTGFIFDRSPFFTPGVYLTIYGGIKSDLEPIGQTVMLKNSVEDFAALSTSLDARGLPINSLVIKSDGQHEFLLDIVSTTGNFSKILFNEDNTLKELLNKIDSAVNEDSFASQFKDESETLEYIDTRFNNRVFYKFKTI